MSRSDFKSLALIMTTQGRNQASRVDVYKACVAVANNGLTHQEETHLNENEKALLTIRRLFRAGFREQAELHLKALVTPNALLEGDRQFLLANVALRKGLKHETAERMSKATALYHQAGDTHREQRALINQIISNATLEDCLYGNLKALEQQAHRDQNFDLVAAIQRTRALELLKADRHEEAVQDAQASVAHFDLDGDPEDRAVAQAYLAIGELLTGRTSEAKLTRQRIQITDGKVSTYLNAFQSLLTGRTPNVPKGHPLELMNWRVQALKKESIPGRIVQRLQLGPATRDELIVSVWGERATDPSYNARLYTAINAAKKSSGVIITFDGSRYRVL